MNILVTLYSTAKVDAVCISAETINWIFKRSINIMTFFDTIQIFISKYWDQMDKANLKISDCEKEHFYTKTFLF